MMVNTPSIDSMQNLTRPAFERVQSNLSLAKEQFTTGQNLAQTYLQDNSVSLLSQQQKELVADSANKMQMGDIGELLRELKNGSHGIADSLPSEAKNLLLGADETSKQLIDNISNGRNAIFDPYLKQSTPKAKDFSIKLEDLSERVQNVIQAESQGTIKLSERHKAQLTSLSEKIDNFHEITPSTISKADIATAIEYTEITGGGYLKESTEMLSGRHQSKRKDPPEDVVSKKYDTKEYGDRRNSLAHRAANMKDMPVDMDNIKSIADGKPLDKISQIDELANAIPHVHIANSLHNKFPNKGADVDKTVDKIIQSMNGKNANKLSLEQRQSLVGAIDSALDGSLTKQAIEQLDPDVNKALLQIRGSSHIKEFGKDISTSTKRMSPPAQHIDTPDSKKTNSKFKGKGGVLVGGAMALASGVVSAMTTDGTIEEKWEAGKASFIDTGLEYTPIINSEKARAEGKPNEATARYLDAATIPGEVYRHGMRTWAALNKEPTDVGAGLVESAGQAIADDIKYAARKVMEAFDGEKKLVNTSSIAKPKTSDPIVDKINHETTTESEKVKIAAKEAVNNIRDPIQLYDNKAFQGKQSLPNVTNNHTQTFQSV